MPNEFIFIAGEKALFSCATDANLPGLSATWLKDNKPIDGAMADRVKIVAKENHFTLELPACTADDGGQYTCRVSDGSGANITCSAHLDVHKRESLLFSYTLLFLAAQKFADNPRSQEADEVGELNEGDERGADAEADPAAEFG